MLGLNLVWELCSQYTQECSRQITSTDEVSLGFFIHRCALYAGNFLYSYYEKAALIVPYGRARKNIGTTVMLAGAPPLEPRFFPCFFFNLEIKD
jgi:hypothetical protein